MSEDTSSLGPRRSSPYPTSLGVASDMPDAVRRCTRCQPVTTTASLLPKDIILSVAQAARGSALAVMLQLCIAWRDTLATYAEAMWISLLQLEMPDLNGFHTRITTWNDEPDELRRLANCHVTRRALTRPSDCPWRRL